MTGPSRCSISIRPIGATKTITAGASSRGDDFAPHGGTPARAQGPLHPVIERSAGGAQDLRRLPFRGSDDALHSSLVGGEADGRRAVD